MSVHQALIRGSPSQSFIDFFISYARADKVGRPPRWSPPPLADSSRSSNGTLAGDRPKPARDKAKIIWSQELYKSYRSEEAPSMDQIEVLITEQDPSIFVLQAIAGHDVQRDLKFLQRPIKSIPLGTLSHVQLHPQ